MPATFFILQILIEQMAVDVLTTEAVLIQQNKLLKSKDICISVFAKERKKLYVYNEMAKDSDLYTKYGDKE
jgi:hypothetical protein